MKELFVKTLISLAIIMAFMPPGLGQSSYENQLKYWYMRWRLTNSFLKMGENQGDGCIMSIRHPFDKPNQGSQFGDQTVKLGFYLATLATEYDLLSQNGIPKDIERTKTELFYAIKSFERLDYNAESLIHNGSPALNGYFMRDDVPSDYLNQTTNPTNFAHFNNELTPEDAPYDITGNDSDYSAHLLSNPGIDEPSGDQYTYMFMGLRLIIRAMPNQSMNVTKLDGSVIQYNFHQEAKNNMDRMITYLKTSYLSANVPVPWFIYTPDGNLVDRGGHYAPFSFAIAQQANFAFGYNTTIPYLIPVLTPFIGYHDFWTWTSRPWWNVQRILPGFQTFDLFVPQAVGLTMAAISDSWRSGSSLNIFLPPGLNVTQSEIYTGALSNDWEAFYSTLWSYTMNKPLTLFPNAIFNRAEELLDIADCRGPRAYNAHEDEYTGIEYPLDYVEGWATPLKWIRTKQENDGPPDTDPSTGYHNGLDYMLLHNLYYHTTSLPLPEYTNYIYRYIHDPVIDLLGNSTPQFKHAFYSITADNIIEPQANVEYRAGHQIRLKPGFHSKNGSDLHAYIDPFSCDNGEYKNANIEDYSKAQSYAYNFREGPGELVRYNDFRFEPKEDFANSNDEKQLFSEEVDEDLSIAIYPNPTENVFMIVLSDHVAKSIRISSIDGQLVESRKNLNSIQFTFDISGQPSGVYFIRVDCGDKIVTKKVVKV